MIYPGAWWWNCWQVGVADERSINSAVGNRQGNRRESESSNLFNWPTVGLYLIMMNGIVSKTGYHREADVDCQLKSLYLTPNHPPHAPHTTNMM
jgi:hypothetical protein